MSKTLWIDSMKPGAYYDVCEYDGDRHMVTLRARFVGVGWHQRVRFCILDREDPDFHGPMNFELVSERDLGETVQIRPLDRGHYRRAGLPEPFTRVEFENHEREGV